MSGEEPISGGAEAPAAAPAGGIAGLSVLLICILALLTLLPNLTALALADPDESRCALIVRNMVDHGQWLVPQLNGKPYFLKPPFYFWASGFLQEIGCPGTGAGRFVSAIAGLAAALLTFDIARRLWDRRTALISALTFMATVGTFLAARAYRMDMVLILCITFSLWCFVRMEFGTGESRRGRWKWWLMFYLGAAIGTLDKGPIAVAMPGAIIMAHFALMGQWRRIRELFNPAGLALYVLVAAPWFVFMSLHFPDYFETFFISENLKRVGPSGSGHFEMLWFYIPVITLGFFPWCGFLPLAVAHSFPRRRRDYRLVPGRSFLWIWVLIVTVFFSVAGTRFPQYVLPAWPPLAMLTAEALQSRWTGRAKESRLTAVGAAVFLALAIGVVVFVLITPHYREAAGYALPEALVFIVVLAAATTAAFVWMSTRAMWIVVFVMMVAAQCILAFDDDRDIRSAMSCRRLGLAVKSYAAPEDYVCAKSGRFSVAYYSDREDVVVEEGPAFFKQLRENIAKGRRYWYVIKSNDLDLTKEILGEPVYVIAATARRDHLLVSNRPLETPGRVTP